MVQSLMKDGFDAFLKITSLHSVSSISKLNLESASLFCIKGGFQKSMTARQNKLVKAEGQNWPIRLVLASQASLTSQASLSQSG